MGEYNPVAETKAFRVELDEILQKMKNAPRKSRSRSIAYTHLEDAIMRLGMDLKEMKEEGLTDDPNPYPESYNPSNNIVHPTSGVQL